MKKTLFFLLLCITGLCQAQNNRFYVDWQAFGMNNGQSWSDAFTNLHDALALAESGDEIWVARGEYRPTTTDDRTARFQLGSGIRLYGGFAGNELLLEQRDPAQNPTILSGDIGVVGDSLDNSYNLLYLPYPDVHTLVDGLVFRDALANQETADFGELGASGSAIYLMARDGEGYATIRNCVFERNTALGSGGAVYANGSGSGSVAPVLESCVFTGNRSASGSGGAYYRNGGSWLEQPGDVQQCRFEYNYAHFTGASIHFRDSERSDSFQIRDCVFYRNFARLHADGVCLGNLRMIGKTRVKVSGCTFEENQATGSLHADQFDNIAGNLEVTVDSCQILGQQFDITNIRQHIYLEILGSDFSVFISNSTFIGSKNTATSIYVGLEEGIFVLKNVLFDDMSGSIATINKMAVDWENVEVKNCQIATLISLKKSPVERKIKNILVYNNQDLPFCGIDESSLTITNGTFVNNTVRESIISNSQPAFRNCIFQNNFYPSGVPAPSVIYTSELYNNNVHYSHCLTDGDTLRAFFDSTTLLSTVAALNDPDNGDFRLKACSPGVDAGDNTVVQSLGITADLTGAPRIVNGVVDMGAFESPEFGPARPSAVQVACSNSAGGGITLFPAFGCEPITYNWDPWVGTGAEVTELPPGVYAVTATDNRGQSFSDVLFVGTASSPTVEAQATDVQCLNGQGGTASAFGSGGTQPYTYHWSHGAEGNYQWPLAAGVYEVTLQDAQGCLDTAVVSVAADGQLTLQVGGAPISCFGFEDGRLSAAAVNGQGPYTYAWSPALGPDSLQTNLPPGQYMVTVTDHNGCTAGFTFNLEEPPLLSVQAFSTPAGGAQTPDGSALAAALGGTAPFHYEWSNQAETQQIADLLPGLYTVTVTDGRGCTATASVTVSWMSGAKEEIAALRLKVWPNPVSDRLWLETDVAGVFELYDVLGRVVLRREVQAGRTELLVPAVPAGGYIWRCSGRQAVLWKQ